MGQCLGWLCPAQKRDLEWFILSLLDFLPCLPPSICFPSVNPALHRQLLLTWQKCGQKRLERRSLSVLVQREPWQKSSQGAEWGWERAQCGQPGPVQCVWWIQHLLLCAELLKCLFGKKEECFVGVGAAKSRFVKFLLLVFQRTEKGWGLSPCGWAPLAEQANTSVLWEHRKGPAQRISSLWTPLCSFYLAKCQSRVDVVMNQLLAWKYSYFFCLNQKDALAECI